MAFYCLLRPGTTVCIWFMQSVHTCEVERKLNFFKPKFAMELPFNKERNHPRTSTISRTNFQLANLGHIPGDFILAWKPSAIQLTGTNRQCPPVSGCVLITHHPTFASAAFGMLGRARSKGFFEQINVTLLLACPCDGNGWDTFGKFRQCACKHATWAT